DFVYNRLFAWKGSFAMATEEHHDCYVSNEFPCFIVNRERADGLYMWRYFSRPSAWDEALGLSKGGTPTSRNRLKEHLFLSMKIPVPPLSEQLRIVAWIEELAGKVEEVRRTKNEIEQMGQQLLQSAFAKITQDVDFLPMIEVAPLVRRPVKVKIAGEYPELGVRSFGNGTFQKPSLSGAEIGSKKIYWIEPGDLVFSNVFSWEGAIAVVKPEDSGRVGSHRFITCVAKEGKVTPSFLCFYFLTEEGLHKIGEASPGGAGRNRTLGLDALAKIRVPVPLFEKQL
ncbi:MAG: restriction endonuclease subunit S, partial [Waddliaceae bacterium]